MASLRRRGRGWRLTTRGASHMADVLAVHVAELSRHMIEKVPPDLSRYLICPMPGLLTAPDSAGWVWHRLAWLPVLGGVLAVAIRARRDRDIEQVAMLALGNV